MRSPIDTIAPRSFLPLGVIATPEDKQFRIFNRSGKEVSLSLSLVDGQRRSCRLNRDPIVT